MSARLYAKLEYLNPTGSVKDRAASYILKKAENAGKLKGEPVVVEATSGNFGISLAALCSLRGIKIIIVMPENMSAERIKILRHYGAEVVLTPAEKGMKGALDRAAEIVSSVPGGIRLGQFENSDNAEAHYMTTAPEIFEDLGRCPDIFVAGVGTGGTLAGCSAFFKEKDPAALIYAVEPDSSPVLSGGECGVHNIQGIGAGFVPPLISLKDYDGVVTVSEKQATDTARLLARTEGIFAGISSGAALYAATELARSNENKNKTIAVILPDGGERYLSL